MICVGFALVLRRLALVLCRFCVGFVLVLRRTEIIIGPCEAKNCAEADFDVKTCLALQKPSKHHEELMLEMKQCGTNKFPVSNIEMQGIV